MLWRTKDGRVIDIKTMDDRHLRNTISYMRRRIAAMEQAENDMWGSYSVLQGEYSQYEAEQCLHRAAEAIVDTHYILQELKTEHTRRQSDKVK